MTLERATLSLVEEQALLRDCASHDSRKRRAALAKLVADNRPRISRIARRFARAGTEREDLMQEGAIGLLIAIDKFDSTLGARLGTYAEYWISAIIRASAWRSSSTIFIPSPVRRRIREVERTSLEGGTASDLGISQEQWESLRTYGLLRCSSLDETDDEGILEDSSVRERLEMVLDLQRALAPLDASQQQTVLSHFGLGSEALRTREEFEAVLNMLSKHALSSLARPRARFDGRASEGRMPSRTAGVASQQAHRGR